MRWKAVLLAIPIACLAIFLHTKTTDAVSDWTGVYARVDRVVFEPNETAPERIQIWGAFTLASKEDRNSYEPAQRGYLYFSIPPGKEEVCRKEWADLKSVAGKQDIVGFGARHLARARIRKADDKPADPDVYPVASGIVKMSDRRMDYGPIKELRSLPTGN